jgi:hypothetical protein
MVIKANKCLDNMRGTENMIIAKKDEEDFQSATHCCIGKSVKNI